MDNEYNQTRTEWEPLPTVMHTRSRFDHKIEVPKRMAVYDRSSATTDSDNAHVRIDMGSSYGPLIPQFAKKAVDSCFMLLSPHTPFENRKRVEAALSWLVQRSHRTVVVDGGYLDRWNFECIDGLSQLNAEAAALRTSSRIERRVKSVIDERGWGDRVEFWDYRLILSDARFHACRSWLHDRLSSVAFANSVDEHIREYVQRTLRTASRSTANLNRLRGYVIEEIALSMVLHSHGLPAECYAGPDFSVVKRMTHGAFGPTPVDISQRTFVSLIVETP